MRKKEGASYIDFQSRHFYEKRSSTKPWEGTYTWLSVPKSERSRALEWQENSTKWGLRANRTKHAGFCISIKVLDFTQKKVLFDWLWSVLWNPFLCSSSISPAFQGALMSILIFLIYLPFKTVRNISFRSSLYLLLSCPSIPEKKEIVSIEHGYKPLDFKRPEAQGIKTLLCSPWISIADHLFPHEDQNYCNDLCQLDTSFSFSFVISFTSDFLLSQRKSSFIPLLISKPLRWIEPTSSFPILF